MTTSEIRKRYLDFFSDPVRHHAIIPSASLVPENDSTTLFTGSGMQPLITYLLGQPHPEGKRLVDSQKSFRAEDIDEVGDNRHTTFFEMLGNWSFGDYWKQEQLPWFFEFLTDKEKGVGLDPNNLYVTVFSGGEGIGRDDEAIGIWKKLFGDANISAAYAEMNTEEEASEKGMGADDRIFGYGVKKNWWSRAGVPSKMPAGEPGGPDSEVFYKFDSIQHDEKFGKFCHPNCDCGRFMEIGNSVFMEYKKREDGMFEKLAQRNVDFGGGLERITAALNNDPDVFKIDVFKSIFQEIKKSYDWDYDSVDLEDKKKMRIIADHVRAGVFMAADGVMPSNKERGYVLRRVLRRAIFIAYDFTSRKGGGGFSNISPIADAVIFHPGYELFGLKEKAKDISSVLAGEEVKFMAALKNGLKEFDKLSAVEKISGKDAFVLFSTYGLPYELAIQMAKSRGVDINEDEFWAEMKKHQDLSRTSSAGQFKGGLADHAEKTIKLHTAHHLLLKALQVVLGSAVKQRGSNITSERLRLDFSYDGKMTDEQKREVEKIVNEKIAEDLPVIRSEMAREDAEKLGAEHEFGQKYPERVSVYSIGPKSATQADPQFAEAYSIEFCGGPHVSHTGEIGHFKLAKEEAVAAGIRRVRGVIE